MKKTIGVHSVAEIKPGDVIVSLSNAGPEVQPWTVEREVPDIAPGTTGSATVRGVEGVRGVWATLHDGERYFVILEADKAGTGSLSSTAEHVTDFVPDQPRRLPTEYDLVAAITDDSPLHLGESALESAKNAAKRVLFLLGGAS